MMPRPILVTFLMAAIVLAACGSSQQKAAGGNCVSAPSDLVHSGTLTWGSDISYPPQESNPNAPVGFDVDIGAAIAGKMCLKSTFKNQGFSGIIPALNAKKFDAILSAMTITSEREKTISFVPYFSAGEALVAKKGSTVHITDVSQLCGYTVAVEDGTAEKDEVNNSINPKCPSGHAITLKVFPTDTEALEQLKLGRVDLHFTDSPVAGYEVQQAPSDLAQVSPILEVAPEGVGIRKSDKALLDDVKKAFKSIEDDGTYDQILAKWGLQGGDIRLAPMP